MFPVSSATFICVSFRGFLIQASAGIGLVLFDQRELDVYGGQECEDISLKYRNK